MSKLVRHKVISIIENSGKTVLYHQEYDKKKQYQLLLNKLKEEVEEVADTEVSNAEDDLHLIEELADVYEVMLAILNSKGYNIYNVEYMAKIKRNTRGDFDSFYVLDEVREK